ncbi:flagellin A [Aeromonas veronii]|uniref:flagellin A n=1 Tax=Aeromonas TaxID=642 RepID=UPI000DE594C9|nr:flagellin A [Aeromonas veronii]BCT36484.1 flagellin A [Aeromonas veronii bv. sobria]MBL0476053.1 flagellin A [Aeromonas veronii]MCX0434603.1 flagellin A [Aeromonas veronii]MDD1843678.1 flagellin A [Aeromonas veronii]BCT36494.1 flagellin A [Aeromonas veronii bv. sobria]
MGLYINTNVSSLNAQRNLMNTTKSLDTSYTRLASGLRINSAKDDAAGLQIANRLTSQINGLDQGNRNANDGISVAQTAEGAMDEITAMLQRMRTLAQQSANDSNSKDDRTALQQEYKQLSTEINRIAGDTTFGGQKILAGGYKGTFQVGAEAGQTISFKMTNSFKLTGIAEMTKGKAVIKAASTATVADAWAVTASTGKVTWGDIDDISGSTGSSAQLALANLDFMIGAVDSKRAELGAVQNRFDSTIRNQANISENVSAARSRIRDADFATETANLTKQNILQQAASTILSQANQRPQSALSLLQG